MSTTIATLTHLACGILSRLVALDEGDGLLDFQTFFRPIPQQYEGTNGPLLIAVILCGGVLEFFVRHTITRVLGTCLVVACLEDRRQGAGTGDSEGPRSDDRAAVSSNVLSLLQRTKLLRGRVRRSITYAFAYSIASGLCNRLASALSSSYLWLALIEIATVVLLERIHLRWTHSILSRTPRAKSALGWSLLLPAATYAVAQKIAADLPIAIGARFAAEGTATTDNVASRDIVVLASAFTLRFFVLYPAWASLISFETRQISSTPDDAGDLNLPGNYGRTFKLCYQKVLVRLAGLHLQAAAIMISIEMGMYMFLHFLLQTPTISPPRS